MMQCIPKWGAHGLSTVAGVTCAADKRQGGNTPKTNQPKPQTPKIKVKGGRFGSAGTKRGK